MRREEIELCEELRVKKAELIATCEFQGCHGHGCRDCGSWASSYVDWLETKLSWLELSARSYRICLTHLDGTEEYKLIVHGFRRSIAICEEECKLYEQGLSVAMIGYRLNDSVAAGYWYASVPFSTLSGYLNISMVVSTRQNFAVCTGSEMSRGLPLM